MSRAHGGPRHLPPALVLASGFCACRRLSFPLTQAALQPGSLRRAMTPGFLHSGTPRAEAAAPGMTRSPEPDPVVVTTTCCVTASVTASPRRRGGTCPRTRLSGRKAHLGATREAGHPAQVPRKQRENCHNPQAWWEHMAGTEPAAWGLAGPGPRWPPARISAPKGAWQTRGSTEVRKGPGTTGQAVPEGPRQQAWTPENRRGSDGTQSGHADDPPGWGRGSRPRLEEGVPPAEDGLAAGRSRSAGCQVNNGVTRESDRSRGQC